MDRRYSIKYRPGVSSREGQQQRGSALNTTYNSTTDNDIFALGDAATGFNIDDLFQDFGMSLNQALQGQFPQMAAAGDGAPSESSGVVGPTKVSYHLHKTSIPEEESENGGEPREARSDRPTPTTTTTTTSTLDNTPSSGTLPPKGHTVIETSTISPSKPPQVVTPGEPVQPGKQDIQVSTITKTLPDGRTVQTRIVRGPVQRKARIIKINRELPNGETELLSTLQIPGDQEVDIDETVKTIVAGGKKQVVDMQGRPTTATTTTEAVIPDVGIRRDHKPPPLVEQYDNVLPHENHVSPRTPALSTPVRAPLADLSEDTRPVPPVPPRRQSLKDKFRDKFRSRSPSASSVPMTPTPSVGSDSQKSPFERVNSIGPMYGYERQVSMSLICEMKYLFKLYGGCLRD